MKHMKGVLGSQASEIEKLKSVVEAQATQIEELEAQQSELEQWIREEDPPCQTAD